ncbi:MAG: hypothetical protein D6686_05325 [Alphaproteobacteria bacterium]|nr:MAG: hypothetical protein D6686_05325 [Alphaproteobacteria bacterium]
MSRRALLYSHDTFGLGHIRRSRTIASALAAADPATAALIVTGSPIAGRFDFPDRVDHVRLPGVVKQPDGSYATHNLGIPIEETVRLRSAILQASEAAFRPDLVIVDKEAWGFRNELAPTLATARARGARIVLGLRDVLDAPEAVRAEWERKGHLEAIERFYDEIWIYGLPEICRPLEGLGLSPRWERDGRLIYTGYLRRAALGADRPSRAQREPYILVTSGGGGDGARLYDWVLSAYESDPGLAPRAVLVYGPFLAQQHRAEFDRRAAALGRRVSVLSFDSRLERWMKHAQGVVSMCGYNTFCEILSFDLPAVVAPRNAPRAEQLIRASAAERLGLLRMLYEPRDGSGPEVMAAAIRGLAGQPRPSRNALPGMLGGLDIITERARAGRRVWSRAGE